MILTKSKIYELKLFVPQLQDKDFRDVCIYGGLIGSVRIGCKKLIYHFVSKGSKKWDDSVYWAVIQNDRKLIDFFLSKGAYFWHARATCFGSVSTDTSIKEFFYSSQN